MNETLHDWKLGLVNCKKKKLWLLQDLPINQKKEVCTSLAMDCLKYSAQTHFLCLPMSREKASITHWLVCKCVQMVSHWRSMGWSSEQPKDPCNSVLTEIKLWETAGALAQLLGRSDKKPVTVTNSRRKTHHQAVRTPGSVLCWPQKVKSTPSL